MTATWIGSQTGSGIFPSSTGGSVARFAADVKRPISDGQGERLYNVSYHKSRVRRETIGFTPSLPAPSAFCIGNDPPLAAEFDTVQHFWYNDRRSLTISHYLTTSSRLATKGAQQVSTAERRAREKARRRRDILDAARQEFFERGFHRPTVDDVAARAEVSKGTIYLYFKSKEEILAHLLLEGLAQLLHEMEAAHAASAQATPEETLRALAHAYLNFCCANPSYFRLIMAFDRGRFEEAISPELYQQVLDQSLRGLELLARSIERGVAEGTFRVEDPWQAAGIVWAAINGVLVLMAHPLRRQMLRNDLEPMFQATLDLVVRGLKAG